METDMVSNQPLDNSLPIETKTPNSDLPKQEPSSLPSDLKPNQTKQPILTIIIVILLILFLILLGLSVYFSQEKKSSITNLEEVTWDTQVLQNSARTNFTNYPNIKTDYVPQIADYQIELSALENLVAFQENEDTELGSDFSEENLEKLTTTHAFTAKERWSFYETDPDESSWRTDDWTGLYGRYAGPTHECYRRLDGSLFISTDYLAHVYHRLLARQMEYMDKEEFAPRLKNMTDLMLAQAKQEALTSNKENRESWQRIEAYLLVAKALLSSVPTEELDINNFQTPTEEKVDDADKLENVLQVIVSDDASQQVKQLANEELQKIYSADEIAPNSIFTGLSIDKESFDYTQFGPRSYYNKNSTLRSYFRAMMWYGRLGFNLSSPELTRDALNLSKVMASNSQVMTYWQEIYEPTTFLVGSSDDLSIYEYGKFLANNYSGEIDNKIISQLQTAAESFKKPQIMSDIIIDSDVSHKTEEELLLETMGWRLMGQRITADGIIFDRLTQGETEVDPVTGEKLPTGISATMVATVLGSSQAESYLSQWTSTNFPDSQQVLNNRVQELKQSFAGLEEKDWTQNSYWSWLYLYKTLINEQKDWTGYPKFMSFENWRKKDLNTIIGSWTELKHDTLLYAKQSYAEMGAGEGPCEIQPVPKGYVEPNIEFYDRLESLATMINSGLADKDLLHREIGHRTDSFIKLLQFYKSIAVKELANETITDEEFEELHISTPILSEIMGVLPGEDQTERESRSALIADVHTDAVNGEVYYEATGIPQPIYVAVNDVNGTRLTKGLVFSHYEFTSSLEAERLNDESWWEVVYSQETETQPNLSPWSAEI